MIVWFIHQVKCEPEAEYIDGLIDGYVEVHVGGNDENNSR